MIELRLQNYDVSRIVGDVLGRGTERCAVLFASAVELPDGSVRMIVKDVEFPEEGSYDDRSEISAQLAPAYVAYVGKKAARENCSIVFLHSHPGAMRPEFSSIDDKGELHLAKFLSVRTPGIVHASAVVSAGGWRGRQLGTDDPMRIVSIGPSIETLFEPHDADESITLRFDRQVRALGAAGQRRLELLTVAIVGLGGTGSIAAEQLAYLGVRKFILVDPDELETTNLNRVVGSNQTDVGRPKVDVAGDHIMAIAPNARIIQVQGDITRTAFASKLKAADCIFSCTDSHGSRAVIQQVAYQYLIPCIDVGSVIAAKDGRIDGIHGRIQALSAGLACFTCSGLLDPEEVRRDMMTEEERHRDPYILGDYEPAPAVISINATVTSLAITMFLAMMVGVPSEGRYVLYNARSPNLKSVSVSRNPNCYICSARGVLARGDKQPLFTRDD